MNISVETRSKQLSGPSDETLTLVKMELSETSGTIPHAVAVNGIWFIPADRAVAFDQVASWDSMTPSTST